MSGAYYNEIDADMAAWLRELMADGLIPAGNVDERSIVDVPAEDLDGYGQCHWFAGIGGWPYALRLAGWPDDRPVWTGSCPCQPFSAAGKRRGTADERHLWPEFRRLIAERRPATVFGEQVASADGRKWLAGVRVDLERMGYAVGAADLCAAGVGAPEIRQRLWWVADSDYRGCRASRPTGSRSGMGGRQACENLGPATPNPSIAGGVADAGATERRWRGKGGTGPARLEHASDGCANGGLANAMQSGWAEGRAEPGRGQVAGGGASGGLADADEERRGGGTHIPQRQPEGRTAAGRAGEIERLADGSGAFWADFHIAWCRSPMGGPPVPRRFGPGAFALAERVPGRVALLRGAGNAIVPQVAAEFVRAWMAEEAAR